MEEATLQRFPKNKKDYVDEVMGAGRGDVGSTFNWDAAYDILLCALEAANRDNFYIRRSSGRLAKAQDIAYADDLLSGMTSLHGLQLKADIVSDHITDL